MIEWESVTGVGIGGIDTGDYPDFADAGVEYAYWLDLDIHLTPDELIILQEQNPEEFNKAVEEAAYEEASVKWYNLL